MSFHFGIRFVSTILGVVQIVVNGASLTLDEHIGTVPLAHLFASLGSELRLSSNYYRRG